MNTFIIGEIGINHNGDLEIAKKMIDISAKASFGCKISKKRYRDCLY